MRPFPFLRAQRLPVVIACLMLFTVGSNYCLLSAWGGNTRMACLTIVKLATAPSCHHCAPAGSASRDHERNRGRSCCPAPVVTPSEISVDKLAAAASVAIPQASVPVAVAATLHPFPASRRLGLVSAGRPPTHLARAPLSLRAPPLA